MLQNKNLILIFWNSLISYLPIGYQEFFIIPSIRYGYYAFGEDKKFDGHYIYFNWLCFGIGIGKLKTKRE